MERLFGNKIFEEVSKLIDEMCVDNKSLLTKASSNLVLIRACAFSKDSGVFFAEINLKIQNNLVI